MVYSIKRKDEEIDAVLNAASEAEDEGRTRLPGMSYEQGVAAGTNWVLGLVNDHPMTD
jgi:hypothetical protein